MTPSRVAPGMRVARCVPVVVLATALAAVARADVSVQIDVGGPTVYVPYAPPAPAYGYPGGWYPPYAYPAPAWYPPPPGYYPSTPSFWGWREPLRWDQPPPPKARGYTFPGR